MPPLDPLEVIEAKVRVPRWLMPGIEAVARTLTEQEEPADVALLACAVYRPLPGTPTLAVIPLFPGAQTMQNVGPMFRAIGALGRTLELTAENAPIPPETRAAARVQMQLGRDGVNAGRVTKGDTINDVLDRQNAVPVTPPQERVNVGHQMGELAEEGVRKCQASIDGPCIVLVVGRRPGAERSSVFGCVDLPEASAEGPSFGILEDAVAAMKGHVRAFIAANSGIKPNEADRRQLTHLGTIVDATWWRMLVRADAIEEKIAFQTGLGTDPNAPPQPEEGEEWKEGGSHE